MYKNAEAVPMDKFAMENEGYHDMVEPDGYLNPAGDESGGQLKQETAMTSKGHEYPNVVQNGRPGLRPKNSRFDSGKTIHIKEQICSKNLSSLLGCGSVSFFFHSFSLLYYTADFVRRQARSSHMLVS